MSAGDQSLPSGWGAYAHPAMLRAAQSAELQQSESLVDNWRQFQQAALRYNLDPNLLALSAARGDLQMLHHHHQHQHRRRMATRETTGVLRAWLGEHKMNPYPTKGEKIMLAVITTMTLTQVSTWFANARRRLKKENKMTWTPRHRPGEEGDDDDVEVEVDDDEDDEADVAPSKRGGDGGESATTPARADRKRRLLSGGCESPGDSAAAVAAEPAATTVPAEKRFRPDEATAAAAQSPAPAALSKPRIWSIVDTATRAEPPRLQHQRFLAAAATTAASAASAALPSQMHLPPRLQGSPAHHHPLCLPAAAAAAAFAVPSAQTFGRPSQPQPPHYHQLQLPHPLMPPPPLMSQPPSALYAAVCEAPPLALVSVSPQLPPHLLRSV